jgi:hypothetical protein
MPDKARAPFRHDGKRRCHRESGHMPYSHPGSRVRLSGIVKNATQAFQTAPDKRKALSGMTNVIRNPI